MPSVVSSTQSVVMSYLVDYVINIVDVMSHIYWMCGHTYSGCNIIDRVGVMTEYSGS